MNDNLTTHNNLDCRLCCDVVWMRKGLQQKVGKLSLHSAKVPDAQNTWNSDQQNIMKPC